MANQNQTNNQGSPVNDDGVPYRRGQANMVFEEWCPPGEDPFQHWMSNIPEQEAIRLAPRGDLGITRNSRPEMMDGCSHDALAEAILRQNIEGARRGNYVLINGPWACCRCGKWNGVPHLMGRRNCGRWRCRHARCLCCRPQNAARSAVPGFVPRTEEHRVSREDDAAVGEPTAAEQIEDPAPDPYADEWQPRPTKRDNPY